MNRKRTKAKALQSNASRFSRMARLARLFTVPAALGLAASHADAVVNYSLLGSTYTQDFGTLPTTGTAQPWTNDTTINGWSLFRQPAPGTAIATIDAGTGSGTAGAFLSYGSLASGERALGGLGSGGAYFGSPATNTVAGWIAVAIQNNTGSAIADVNISYDGEQWRNGGNASLASQTMVLEYGIGASFTTVPTWTAAGAGFNFTSLANSATAAALDGNNAANRTANIGGTISSVNVANTQTLWFRWQELNDTGNDHGLAVDNFAFSTSPITPPPPPPPPPPGASPLFINEVDYDQPASPSDNAEFIELAGPAGLYQNVQIQLINGNGDFVYQTINIPDFTLTNESNGFGFFVLSGNAATVPNTDLDLTPDVNLIENGAPDAIALLVNGVLVHYLSYEGTTGLLVGGQGPNDILAGADSNTTASLSFQKVGTGSNFGNFSFSLVTPTTPGAVNNGQTFVAPSAAIIPEPATLGLLGVAGLALVRRRRIMA